MTDRPALTAQKFHLDCQEGHLKLGKKPGDAGFGIEPEEWHGTLTKMEGDKPSSARFATIEPVTYREFYSQLATALAGKGENPVKPEGPSEVIRLIELAKQSSLEGRTLDV